MNAPDPTARLTALADRDLPESWIPSADEPTIVGEFLRLEQGPTVHGPAWIVILKTEEGHERSVWLLHTVLRNEFARLRPQPGEFVLIKHEGKKENAAGQSYEAYRVIVDREQTTSDWEAVAATHPPATSSEQPAEDGVPY